MDKTGIEVIRQLCDACDAIVQASDAEDSRPWRPHWANSC